MNLAEIIKYHQKYLPAPDGEVLPSNWTGHQAYKAASKLIDTDSGDVQE